MSKNNEAADIIINQAGKEYKDIDKTLNLDTPSLTFLLALYGLANDNFIEYWNKSSENNEHSFSRTTYSKNSSEYDSYFGLITLLKHMGEPVDEITKIAFESTSDNNVSFNKLENVRNYYGYLVGGTKLLHYDIFKNGKDKSEVALALFEILQKSNIYDTSRLKIG